MSASLHHQTCCCCPARVDVKGTYKTVGSGTIDKFKPHARGTVTENVTRACYKCYVKYTRPPKKKVIHAVFQRTCMISYSSHVRTHTGCIAVWYTLWNSCLCSSFYDVVQKHNQLQTLADAALQSHTDQDMEHKHDDKICDGTQTYMLYVCMHV